MPGALFVGCLWSMLVTVRRHRNGLLGAGVYLWLAVDVLVMVFATSWLAKSLQVLWNSGLSAEQAQATLTAGPALFMALALFLLVRPVTRAVSRCFDRMRPKAGTSIKQAAHKDTGKRR